MVHLLLAIIYISFISLGLPDALLGAAWPIMSEQFAVPLSYAGAISVIVSMGTITSSLLSDRLTLRFGAGKVTAFSVAMTAVALFGFSVSSQYWHLLLWAIPYGLGAGGVDAALNNYVAVHYASRHMSWLHCFWGVGVSISPYIMGYAIGKGEGWRQGYSIVSIIQVVLTIMLFASLPLWAKKEELSNSKDSKTDFKLKDAIQIKGVIYVLLAFFGYCAFESTCGLWASSYLAEYRGVDSKTAAAYASIFYLGITFGRLLSGFIADKFGDKRMIRAGLVIAFVGVSLVILPLNVQGIFLAKILKICYCECNLCKVEIEVKTLPLIEHTWNNGEIKAKKGDSIFIPAGLETNLCGNANILYSCV